MDLDALIREGNEIDAVVQASNPRSLVAQDTARISARRGQLAQQRQTWLDAALTRTAGALECGLIETYAHAKDSLQNPIFPTSYLREIALDDSGVVVARVAERLGPIMEGLTAALEHAQWLATESSRRPTERF